MIYLLLLFFLFLLYLLWVELYPVKLVRARRSEKKLQTFPPLYLYSFELHIHTQFSHDSLGKPEDLLLSAKEENIDFLIVTDHDNDHIKHFAGPEIVPGKELKLTDEKGRVMGNLLEFGDIKVIAHPFKEKYRWRLPICGDYFFELIDLKDALLEKKLLLFALLPAVILRGLVSTNLALNLLKKLIDIRKYARLYLKMDIDNPVVGGLDHHVKVYIREVGIRFLFPHYTHSFRLMRNFLISDRKLGNREEFLKELKKGNVVISFDRKPTIFWREGDTLRVLSPSDCLLEVLCKDKEEFWRGSYFEIEPCAGKCLFLGYTYKLRVWNLYLGVEPLFVFLFTEERDALECNSKEKV